MFASHKDKWKEVDHYDEIKKGLMEAVDSNLSDPQKYKVRIFNGELSAGLRGEIKKDADTSASLNDYSNSVHKLHLDITILIENKLNGKFRIVIFEIKKTKALGLTHLSQLIGYCLVSRCEYGILVNVDNPISSEFSVILNSDKDVTNIRRSNGDSLMSHKFGVMRWDSKTLKFDYLAERAAINTIPRLIRMIEDELE